MLRIKHPYRKHSLPLDYQCPRLGLNIELRSSYLGWLGEAVGEEEEEIEKVGQDITTHCLHQHQSRDKNFKFSTQSFVLFWYLESPYRRQSLFPDPWQSWAILWPTSRSLGNLIEQHSVFQCSIAPPRYHFPTSSPCESSQWNDLWVEPDWSKWSYRYLWCYIMTSDSGGCSPAQPYLCVVPPVATAGLVRPVSWPVSGSVVRPGTTTNTNTTAPSSSFFFFSSSFFSSLSHPSTVWSSSSPSYHGLTLVALLLQSVYHKPYNRTWDAN